MKIISREEILQTREELRAVYPEVQGGHLEVLQKFGIASEIVIRTLGPSWWQTRLTPVGQPGGYFRNQPSTEHESYEHMDRVIELGDTLYLLRNVRGFEHRLIGLQTVSLEGAMFELFVAKLLYKNGVGLNFVEPSGMRGHDYDILLEWEGSMVCVEVKSKDEDTSYSANSLSNTLNEARRQLPDNQAGLVFVRAQPKWIQDTDFASEVERVLNDFYRSTGRVNGVYIFWHEWFYIGKKRALAKRFRYFPNDKPRTVVPNLQNVMKRNESLPDLVSVDSFVPVSFWPDS